MVKPMFYIYKEGTEEISRDEGIPVHKEAMVIKTEKDDRLRLRAVSMSVRGLEQYVGDFYCGHDEDVFLKEVPAEAAGGLKRMLRREDKRQQDNLNPNCVYPQREPREYVIMDGTSPTLGVRFRFKKEDLEEE